MTADALVSLAALVAFACLFYGPWQAACTDIARQMIFERRDEIFDLARAGKLDFSSAEYKSIRRSMEGLIRYAHELTWVSLFFYYRGIAKHNVKRQSSVARAVASIEDPFVREKVNGLLSECTVALIAMIAAKSLLIAPVVLVVGIYAFCTHSFKSLLQSRGIVTTLSDTIQSGAECAI
jgi:hypothetical protein